MLFEELDDEFGASKALLANAIVDKERIKGYALRIDLLNTHEFFFVGFCYIMLRFKSVGFVKRLYWRSGE